MALVLTRAIDEEVVIGGGDSGYPEVRVKLIQLDRGKCRLAFTAPRDIPVMRSELLDFAPTDGRAAK